MISPSVEFTFAAEVEALQPFLWYETIKKGLGENFKASVDLKIDLLQKNPKAYSFIYKDIRSAKIKTFPIISFTEYLTQKFKSSLYFIIEEIRVNEKKEYSN